MWHAAPAAYERRAAPLVALSSAVGHDVLRLRRRGDTAGPEAQVRHRSAAALSVCQGLSVGNPRTTRCAILYESNCNREDPGGSAGLLHPRYGEWTCWQRLRGLTGIWCAVRSPTDCAASPIWARVGYELRRPSHRHGRLIRRTLSACNVSWIISQRQRDHTIIAIVITVGTVAYPVSAVRVIALMP
jgi:hypothetical protein